jgi:hypothetical protein
MIPFHERADFLSVRLPDIARLTPARYLCQGRMEEIEYALNRFGSQVAVWPRGE